MKRDITNLDLKMFYQLMHLKELSVCIDKQVACIIADKDTGDIVAVGLNTPYQCDKNCDDKEHRTCVVEHAEANAVRHLRNVGNPYLIAYVSLFPCAPCQRKLIEAGVKEIVAFGMIHKDWVVGDALTVFHHLPYTLLSHNTAEHQRTIASGELAELITAISDYFARDDKDATTYDILDEIFDVELQLDILKLMVHSLDKETYNKLRVVRNEKTRALLARYAGHGISSYTD